MSLDRAFYLSSILLAGAAFGSLALTADVPTWLLALGAVTYTVCLVRIVTGTEQRPWLAAVRLSPVAWNIILLTAFAEFWIDVLWISQELLSAGIRFLIVLMINKLFNLQQRRDFLHLYAISLMAVLASASLTTQVWYAPMFLAYLFAGIWTLLLYHLTKEREDAATGTSHIASGTTQDGGQITSRFFWTTNGMAVCAVCLTLSIFFIIPRVGVGLLQKNRGEGLRTTGFSERVDLGVMGSIKEDPSIVMRVELPDSKLPKGNFYLRGMAYDHYNGRSWSTHLSTRRPLNEKPQGTFTIRPGGSQHSKKSSPEIRQDIVLEPLDTPVLFGAPGASSITGDLMGVQSDSMGALFLPFPPSNRTEYTIRSRSALLELQEQSATLLTYPEFVRQHYLQLPPLSPQVAELTHGVAQDGHTPYEIVTLVRDHLLTTYRYSLDLEATQSNTPVEDFLFIRKTGYCEHYATAMILMLRSIGIPSRLVTGFLASEWNRFGNYYTVRQRDAHAWVEVYFPHSGWITFDPTPPVALAQTNRWWQSVEGLLDSIRLQWDRVFIQYSATDQLAVLQGVREGGDVLRNSLSESLASRLGLLLDRLRTTSTAMAPVNVKQAAFMLVFMMTGLLLLAAILLKKPWKNLRGERAPAHQVFAVRVYGQMTAFLETRGIQRSAHETPTEFVRHVEREWAAGSFCVRKLTDLYCRVRFGQHPVTSEDVTAAQHLLDQLQNLG